MINRHSRKAILAAIVSSGLITSVQASTAVVVEASKKSSLFIPKAPAIIKPPGFWRDHEDTLLAMPMTMGLLGKPFQPSSYSFTDAIDGSDTFTTAGIGSADATRIIVAAVSYRSTGPQVNLTGCTIDGNAMTLGADSGLVNTDRCGIYYLAYPTGTTADFVSSATGDTGAAIIIAVYAVYNPISSTPVFGVGAFTTVVVNALADDIVIGVSHERSVGFLAWTAPMVADHNRSYGGFGSAASVRLSSSMANCTGTGSEIAALGFR